jgi:serine protease Do
MPTPLPLTLLAALGAVPGPAPEGSAAAIYEAVAPAVVAITCEVAGSQYFGTGTIIDPKGWVVTSTTVVPQNAKSVQIYLRGGVVLPAKLELSAAEKELSILRVEASVPQGDFPSVRLGDSRRMHVGDAALSFGNAYASIQADDQVTLGEGIVSGLYSLQETHSESKYRGLVIETTAHVNDGMDGGPLIDGSGSMVGVLCLNYSLNRWLGTAVPIGELMPLIGRVRGWFSDTAESLAAYAGLELEEVGGDTVRVLRVEESSPAALAGLSKGSWITSVEGMPIRSLQAFREAFGKAKAGSVLRLGLRNGDAESVVELRLWGKEWRWT